MSSIVIYFSRAGENVVNFELKVLSKGHTEIVAEKIARFADAKLFQIIPEEPYPFNYAACKERANKEQQENDLPLIANLEEHLLDGYDIVYVGFPIWGRSYPRIIGAFLQCYDLNGKVIRPFCTNEEGDFGIAELELRALLKDSGATLRSGLSIKGAEASRSDDIVKAWVIG